MRLFISVDIEGITGIASFSQCGGGPHSGHYDFAFARRMMTHDVNAAIRGARSAGVNRIVVKDSHGTCKNLLIDELEPGVELISGFGSGTHGMMEGIQEGFDAAMLIGYHARAGLAGGMMDHALTGGVHRFWINDREVGEMAVSAALAGEYGIPTVLVTSDDTGCAEAKSDIPGVQTYSTKTGFSRSFGRMLHPSETGPAIESAAKSALQLSAKPLIYPGPVTITVEFHKTEEADLASTCVGVARVDGYTVRFDRPTFLEAHHTAQNVFMLSIQGRQTGS